MTRSAEPIGTDSQGILAVEVKLKKATPARAAVIVLVQKKARTD
jgi:hypothetical protein